MITLDRIEKAAALLEGKISKTPLVFSQTLSELMRAQVYLKLENLQRTGSFKIRGATCKILNNRDGIGPNGVVAASAGNHAQGVALAASQAGVTSTIVMPEWASISKQEATSHYGGNVLLEGDSLEESLRAAEKLSEDGRMFIHPFDDPDIVAGQGTIALEILAQQPEVDLVLVPVGGGGLISGIAAAAKTIRPEMKIIGVQAENCPSAHNACKLGTVLEVAARSSLADGINVKKIGAVPFELIRRYVDDMVLVNEGYIARALLMLLERKKTIAEGAGATPLAALLQGVVRVPSGARVVLVVSGGNVDTPVLGRIISQGLMENGRVIHLQVRLDDHPGSLAGVLSIVAELKANVLQVSHQRCSRDLPLNATKVDLELETRGAAHIDAITSRLEQAGYLIDA